GRARTRPGTAGEARTGSRGLPGGFDFPALDGACSAVSHEDSSDRESPPGLRAGSRDPPPGRSARICDPSSALRLATSLPCPPPSALRRAPRALGALTFGRLAGDVRAVDVPSAASSPDKGLLMLGGAILLLIVLSEVGFLSASARLLRRAI